MSLYKNLLIYAKLYGLKSDRVVQVLQQVGLADAKDIIAEKLSTGMKQRMFLARALLNAPKILFLDEPTSGLDPTTSKMIHTLLQELKQAGTTIESCGNYKDHSLFSAKEWAKLIHQQGISDDAFERHVREGLSGGGFADAFLAALTGGAAFFFGGGIFS